MKLVAGLGNPGDAYARTRHNLGFRVADGLAATLSAPFALKKFGAEIAEGKVNGERVWVLKPQTYMNASGEAVGPALRFWKLGLEDLVVVHDDLELPAFRVQVKVGGGHGGNNGVKSVTAHVGGPDYCRVRLGIGRPPGPVDPADFVLGRFPRAEDGEVEAMVGRGVEAALAICEAGVVKAMNRFNRT